MSGAARRAVTRWSWRLFRREWRQQILVIGLISSAVAAAVFGAAAAYNMTSNPDADFGSATQRFELTVSEPDALAPYLAAAEEHLGPIEVIGHRQIAVPGSTSTVELRSVERDATYREPMLAVTAGRSPSAADEIAVTDGVASLYDVEPGDRVTLDGSRLQVVGLVENPADLDDEFALAPASAIAVPESITVLSGADEEAAFTFRPPAEPGSGFTESREVAEQATAAVTALAAASVAMVLVCLVAGASFVTLAHRRLSQLGMLAAVGATARDLRRAMVVNGAAVGAVAAVIGTGVAFVCWMLLAPALEAVAAHRIDRLAVPWWLPATGAALALVTAVAAAWWPAWSVARIPVTDAISARPPQPKGARRSVALGAALFVLGLVGIGLGVDPASDDVAVYLLLPGVGAVAAAILLLGAPVLGAAAGLAGRLPIGARLALRDLARHRARSAAALGAISMGLAIAVSITVIAAANAPQPDEGNLAADQLFVWTSDPGEFGGLQVPETTASERGEQEAALEEIVRLVEGAEVVPLGVAVDPENPEVRGGRRLLNTAVLGRRVDANTLRDSGLIFTATPALLAYLDVEPAASSETLVLTRQHGEIYITGNITDDTFRRAPLPAAGVTHIDVPDHSSAPRTLISEAGMNEAGLVPLPAGWLVDVPEGVDPAVTAELRSIADDAGMAVEIRDNKDRVAVRTAATAAGVLLALCILAMTVGLLRSDAAQDVATLIATGASTRTRRTLTACTSGVLALLGAVLGTIAAYAVLITGYWPQAARLGNIPLAHLLVIALGLPLLATALTWVVAGRERPDLVASG